ncbi:MAG: IS607 family transposase [Candidatus Hodarchaeota archaeon]
MKAQEVRRLLKISPSTLYRYHKQGKLRATELASGHFCYNDGDVYRLMRKGMTRKTYLYARVSTYKQKVDLGNQIDNLQQWAIKNGYPIHGIYKDIASGISFEKRKDFFQLLEEVLNYRVKTVIITYKDRLSRIGFGLFLYLFQKYGTEIVVISEVGNPKLDSQEMFEEIIAMLHCYSMSMYSRRRGKKKLEIGMGSEKKKGTTKELKEFMGEGQEKK